MYAFDLQAKLKRLNPRLLLDSSKRAEIRPGIFTVGVYEKFAERKSETKNKSVVSNDTQRYLEQIDSGQLNYLAGIAYPFVPEYDQFDLETGQLTMRGWRSLVKFLADKRIVDIRKARKVFVTEGLGTSTYDRLSYDGKLAWARREQK